MADASNPHELSSLQADALDDLGHRFRGRFLHKCSAIERWAHDILDDARVRVGNSKPPVQLCEKLAAVRKLATKDLQNEKCKRLKYPDRVIALLDDFEPYTGLRNILAHSTQVISFSAEGKPIYIFAPACGRASWIRAVLSEADQAEILSRVAGLAKRFADQRLCQVNPSSPPPPKPAGAAGP